MGAAKQPGNLPNQTVVKRELVAFFAIQLREVV